MPIYEYKCRKCSHRFEVLQRINADNSEICCPRCKADKPERLLSSFSSSSKGKSSSTSCAPGGFS